MIKFTAHGKQSNRLLIGIGITEANVERLKDGKPIKLSLDGDDFGLPHSYDVVIFYGKDEQDIYEELRSAGMITDETDLRDRRAGPEKAGE